MSKKTNPPLRVAMDYVNATDADLVAQALAGHDGVKAHPELFPNPPDLQAVSGAIQSFQTSMVAAQDGGKKAIAEKKKQRAALIKLLRPLGHYVEGRRAALDGGKATSVCSLDLDGYTRNENRTHVSTTPTEIERVNASDRLQTYFISSCQEFLDVIDNNVPIIR